MYNSITHKIKKYYILIFLLSFTLIINNCNKKENTPLTLATLFKNNSGNLYFESDSNLKIIGGNADTGLSNNLEGGFYQFYANDNLKSFQYFINKDTFDYSEKYDSLGKLIDIKGKPLTFSYINIVNSDSVNIESRFFSLNKKYGNLFFKTDYTSTENTPLINDSVFTFMKVAKYGIKFPLKNDFSIFLG